MLAFVRKVPVLRWLVCLIAGLLFPVKSLMLPVSVALTGVWLLVVFPILEKRLSTAWSGRWIPGFSLACIWFSLGGLHSYFLEKKAEAPPLKNAITVTGRLESVPEVKNGYLRFVLEINGVAEKEDGWYGKRIRVRMPIDKKAQDLEVNDQIIAYLRPSKPAAPDNPYVFDYAGWLHRQGICAVSAVYADNWRLYRKAAGFSLRTRAERCRGYLIRRLKESGMSGEELALASALLLGETQNLDQATKAVFSQAGISHILSVSGLHVAVIYSILSFLLSFTNRCRLLKVPRQLLLITLLILYAFLTGLSPSVLRSVFMFSLLILGKTLNRRSQPLNTVLFSALLLLLIHPAYLYDLGFRLSYIAVIFLVAVYPPVVARWNPSGLLLNKVWKALALSLVAQVGTAPLTIAVFHSFPNYFLLNNALAVPFSSLLLVLGAITLLMGGVPWVGGWIALLTMKAYRLFLDSAGLSAHLPFSTASGLELTGIQVVMLYLLMAFLFAWVIRQRRSAFRPVLLVVLCLQFLALLDNFKI